MKRSADESQVSVLLKDFEDVDKMLTRVRGEFLTPVSHSLVDPISWGLTHIVIAY